MRWNKTIKCLALIQLMFIPTAFSAPSSLSGNQNLMGQINYLRQHYAQGGQGKLDELANSSKARKKLMNQYQGHQGSIQSLRKQASANGRLGKNAFQYTAQQANGQQDSSGMADHHTLIDNPQLHEQGFKEMANDLLPLTPHDIKRLHRMFKDVRRAADAPVETPPKPTSSSVMVDLSPGSAPPVIRHSSGFVSTLVFLDQTGKPWPIQAYDIGNPQNFDVQWDKKSNMLMVQAQGSYRSANLVVKLKGKNTPVVLTLMPEQKVVDFRVDLHIPGYGPNSEPEPTTLPSKPSSVLLNILDGVPPKQAKRLEVSGGDAKAWLYRNKLYLRTNDTILSPSWTSVMSSTDGTNAYELKPSPVVLTSHDGQMLRLRIEGMN